MFHTLRRVALASLALLLLPLIASRLIDGWNWPPQAFLLLYVLFFLTGLSYALITRNQNLWSYKLATALSLAAGFVIAWSTMVRLSETENRLNLIYFAILALGAAGAALSRLAPRGMSRTLFLMAASVAAAWLITHQLSSGAHPAPHWQTNLAHTVFVLVLASAALLFRHARLATPNVPKVDQPIPSQSHAV
jgi:hypothetical protein